MWVDSHKMISVNVLWVVTTEPGGNTNTKL